MPGTSRHTRSSRPLTARRRSTRFSRRRLALILAIAVIPWGLASVGRAPDEAAAATVGPALDQWTPTTQVFQIADGTMTADIYSAPIQGPAATETGWAPIDTTLEFTADGLEPGQADASIQFSSGDQADPLATVEQGGASLSVDLTGD